MKPWTLSIKMIPCSNDVIGDFVPDLHASNSPAQYTMSRNWPITGNYGELPETSEFASGPSPIRDTVPSPTFGNTSGSFFSGNMDGEGNRGRSFEPFGAEASVGADQSYSRGNAISRNNSSVRRSFNGTFERTLSPNTNVKLKRNFSTFSEVSNHRGEWPRNNSGDSWQTLFPTPVHEKSPQLYNTNNRPQQSSSIGFQTDHSPNETSNTQFFPMTWSGTSPVAISGFAFGRQTTISGSMENTTDSNFTQALELDTFANRDSFPHFDPQHDHMGYPHTFSRH